MRGRWVGATGRRLTLQKQQRWQEGAETYVWPSHIDWEYGRRQIQQMLAEKAVHRHAGRATTFALVLGAGCRARRAAPSQGLLDAPIVKRGSSRGAVCRMELERHGCSSKVRRGQPLLLDAYAGEAAARPPRSADAGATGAALEFESERKPTNGAAGRPQNGDSDRDGIRVVSVCGRMTMALRRGAECLREDAHACLTGRCV